MRDRQNTDIAELIFALGKATRRAIDHTSVKTDPVELTKIGSKLLEAGHEKVPSELLMLFVAGFEEGHPSERRVDPENR